MRLKRETFRHIEAEIRGFYDTLREMEELRRDIALSGSCAVKELRVSGGYEGSGVERRATILADSVLLREMEKVTSAILRTYEVARDECRLVVWARYGFAYRWEPPEDIRQAVLAKPDMPVRDLSLILGMDESTFHRYRTGFVYGVAERLGWF